ncbi:TBC1 domain family member 5 homolog A [Setaria italica]|nr:TBC1 domain family member 5 homolog A [Setaria italica]
MTMPGSPARPGFSALRGARWRADLGVLPDSPAVSIDELRRAAADSRRRYANLRRRLLIDPHLSKDEEAGPDLVVENPLSQNPESTWGQYFRNAELEKMLNQDLSRLYPELGDFFQTSTCQSMLGRILLVWSLRYPEFGYRQGMHELLAPLLYVLHADVQHFKQVRDLHEELLDDDFDGQTFPDRSKLNRSDRKNNVEGRTNKIRSLADLDPDTRDLFSINDAYGAEGELGIILSEKFMEHDAYSMFENLMNGAQGVVAITDFYSLSPSPESSSGLTPVREASSAIYHLLASVDSSLHSHLVELGVEPQYFALRWLRVLFGREFSLDNLLFIWDEIFSSPNHSYCTDIRSRADYQFKVLCSPRGALILSMAVSMMLHLRSSLLGSEHATSCLVRLLNFPEDIDIKSLIEKATLLQSFALEANLPSSPVRGKSLLTKPNYWEETWKILQSSIDQKGGGVFKMKGRGFLRRSWSNTESNVSRSKAANLQNKNLTSTRQSAIDELHNTDVVPAKLINSVPHMPIEEQKDHVGQSTLEATGSNSKNACETGQHDGYCSTSGEIGDPLGASGYLSRSSSTSLSCGTEYDHDTHHVEEPCVPRDDNVVNDPDPLPLHGGRTDEVATTMDRTSGIADTHPVQHQNPTIAEGGQKETLAIGSISNVSDKELTRTLRSLGESMVENIQAIEFLVEILEKSMPRSTEQAKAVAALKELRKISDLLRQI